LTCAVSLQELTQELAAHNNINSNAALVQQGMKRKQEEKQIK
jgi:hypothetical protein